MHRLIYRALILACATFIAACAALDPVERSPMQFTTVMQDGKPIQLAYRDLGQGDPVILIHGFGANSYTWRHLEPALVKTNRVISLDLKGFGQSDKPLDKRYSVIDQAQLVSQFIDQKRLKKVTLVGHSLGGGVALAIALEDAGKKTSARRIDRLVLIDSVAYAQKIPIAFNVLRAPLIGRLSNFLVPKELQARAALRIAYYDNSKFNRLDVANYAEPLHDPGSQHALIQSARQIIPENIDDLAARYATIKVPALVLWCNRDKVIKPHIGWRLHRNLANSTFRLLKDCGHIPQEERPQETARIISDFLTW